MGKFLKVNASALKRVIAATITFCMILLIMLIPLAGMVFGLSPAGTPERDAENRAMAAFSSSYGGYTLIDAQMRSNQLSIALPARNRIGNRVDFYALVRKVYSRDGRSYRYEVGPIQFKN